MGELGVVGYLVCLPHVVVMVRKMAFRDYLPCRHLEHNIKYISLIYYCCFAMAWEYFSFVSGVFLSVGNVDDDVARHREHEPGTASSIVWSPGVPHKQ